MQTPLQNSLPFFSLRVRVLCSDLLLKSEGGVYSDLHAAALKPVNEWIPARLKLKLRAVMGIE